MERVRGQLHLGERLEPATGERTGAAVLLDSGELTTHGVIVGMTGSGKTGLGLVLLEEARLADIAVLAIDPKGDLGNLALVFPSLAPKDFEPWVDPGAARLRGLDRAQMAAETARDWTDGLASWGLGPPDLARLAARPDPVVYTPGSRAGVPLDLLGRLSAPTGTDPGLRRTEVDATVAGLLRLVGVDSDPLSGREHILLATLVERSWDAGEALDLGRLVGQVLDPPLRRLGVLDLESFFPAEDRRALATALNGLLASPSFAAWAEGEALDMASLLWDAEGRARSAVVSIAHLGDTERQFAVAVVLARLISWMRTQPGSSALRVLVYLDEVAGLAPPVANPPAKGPILTLAKQARAFGVGLVVAAQNPVDLDYRALSNAGTWLIGRLQTRQDRDRLIDGLRSADGGDPGDLERTVGALGPRQFLLRRARSAELTLFGSRWAMSYLAGPLTTAQIARLAPASAPAGPGAAPAPPPVPSADDETPLAPTAPPDVAVRWLAPSAPWAAAVGATPGARRHEAVVAARVRLVFDEARADLRHDEEWEAIVPLGDTGADLNALVAVDYDDRDLATTPPADAAYAVPPVALEPALFRRIGSELRDRLHATQTLAVLRNPSLGLWSRPDEGAEAFARRCQAAADAGADAAAAKVRDRIARRQATADTRLAKARDRVVELEAQRDSRQSTDLFSVGATLVGGLLGGRRSARSLATAARRAAAARGRSSAGSARLDSARNRVAEADEALAELAEELTDQLLAIDDEWTAKRDDVHPAEVPLERSDITVEDLTLLWLPRA